MEIPSKTTTLEILEAINEWAINARSYEVHNMWNILTALRGPDSDNEALKSKTTIFIRSAVLPDLAERANANIVFYLDNRLILKQLGDISNEKYYNVNISHFSQHAIYAANSILSSQGQNFERG